MNKVQLAPLLEDMVEFAKILSTTPVVQPLSTSPEALKKRKLLMKRRERRKYILRRNIIMHLGGKVD